MLLKLIQKIPYKKLSNYNYTVFISDDNSEDLASFKYIKIVKDRFGSKIKINSGTDINIKFNGDLREEQKPIEELYLKSDL